MSRRGLTAIDAEIVTLKNLIDTLQRREDDACRLRDSLQADKRVLIERCKDLEAEKRPINWLPNELLIQIFIQSSESTESDVDADEPFHSPPVIFSHVCRKWREVCLVTSQLWSRISYTSTKLCLTALQTFIERSNNSPLDLVFKSPRRFRGDPDIAAFYVLANLRPHISRLQSIIFHCHGGSAMKEMIDIINAPTRDLSHLRSLTLQITGENPSFSRTLSMVRLRNSQLDDQGGIIDYSPTYNSSLRELRLKQVPPVNVPAHLLASVLSLELCFPPRRITTSHYILRMSELRQFLGLAPQLTDLVLSDTVPFFDVLLNAESNPDLTTFEPGEIISASSRLIHSVELPRLRRLEWTYPYPSDVHRLLAFLFTPSLETLDLCLDDMSLTRQDTALIRGYDDADAARDDTIVPRVIQLESVKELSVQCVDDDALTLVFRRIAFPALEKMVIANVDANRRRNGSQAPLPRLESIFRDPRLPYLTHLTLSHFHINPEYDRSMLGYMPALTFLSLDRCLGVRKVLGALAEISGGLNDMLADPTGGRKLAVKFCPRLNSLSLLGCNVDAHSLRNVVRVRNTGGVVDAWSKQGGMVPRPMKKLRRPPGKISTIGLSSTPIWSPVATGGASTVISLEECLHSTRIECIRVENCSPITKEEMLSMKFPGVVDIMWKDAT